MSPSLVLEFTKMHGAGNDFLVLDNRWYRFSDDELADLAATWCPRRYGVGADGLLALAEADADDVDYRMRYVNSDGSWATMCGNGARCLARFAMNADFEGPEVSFETDAGRYHAAVSEEHPDLVRLYVPPATEVELDVRLQGTVPFSPEAVHYAHTGTGHLVVFVPDVEVVPVGEWAPALRNDPRVEPPGANVNFVEAENGTLRVRTYEKGVEGKPSPAAPASWPPRLWLGSPSTHPRIHSLWKRRAALSASGPRRRAEDARNTLKGPS